CAGAPPFRLSAADRMAFDTSGGRRCSGCVGTVFGSLLALPSESYVRRCGWPTKPSTRPGPREQAQEPRRADTRAMDMAFGEAGEGRAWAGRRTDLRPADFPVCEGMIRSYCALVEDANPRYWEH